MVLIRIFPELPPEALVKRYMSLPPVADMIILSDLPHIRRLASTNLSSSKLSLSVRLPANTALPRCIETPDTFKLATLASEFVEKLPVAPWTP